MSTNELLLSAKDLARRLWWGYWLALGGAWGIALWLGPKVGTGPLRTSIAVVGIVSIVFGWAYHYLRKERDEREARIGRLENELVRI